MYCTYVKYKIYTIVRLGASPMAGLCALLYAQSLTKLGLTGATPHRFTRPLITEGRWAFGHEVSGNQTYLEKGRDKRRPVRHSIN